MVACCGAGVSECRGRPQVPADLAANELLTLSVRSNWNNWHFRRGDEVRVWRASGKLRANQAEILRVLTLGGAGIARFADFNVRADIAAGRLVALLEDWSELREETMWLFHASGRQESARVRAFVDFMSRSLRPSRAAITRP